MDKRAQFAVVGATGTVGREVLAALQDAGLPAANITALATERSEGEELEFADETIAVEKTDPAESFRGMSAVILATPPDVSRTLASAAQAAGAWTVDVSPAFRADPNVPLVLPAVNLGALGTPFKGRVVATPSPVTAALLTLLEPLRAAFGLRRVSTTALLSASSGGKRGISELEKQVANLLSGRDAEPEVFPHRIAFNAVPQVGEFGAGGWTDEERAWRDEAARIWPAAADLPVLSGTAVQVPTFYGHALSISLELAQPVDEGRVRAELRNSKALKVLDSPEEKIYPMPMLITADPTVHVGRIRAVPRSPGWFELFAVIDNAGRGAAQNAVELAFELLKRSA